MAGANKELMDMWAATIQEVAREMPAVFGHMAKLHVNDAERCRPFVSASAKIPITGKPLLYTLSIGAREIHFWGKREITGYATILGGDRTDMELCDKHSYCRAYTYIDRAAAPEEVKRDMLKNAALMGRANLA